MQDLTSECLSDLGKELQSLGVSGLRSAMCARCFNPQCGHSRSSGTLWEQRMSTQADRLLINPHFADPTSSRYEPVVASVWETVRPRGWISLNDQTKDSGIPESPQTPPRPLRNTPVPAGGILLEGPAPEPVADPWALPPKTVRPGAVVKMGQK